jgi:hypothetical protein
MAIGPSYPDARNSPRYMGTPIRLNWEGWESDTYTLQQSGWEVSVAQDQRDQKMQIALKNRHTNMVGISRMMDFDYREIWDKEQYLRNIVFPIVHIAPQINILTLTQATMTRGIRIRGEINWDSFKPIDATPSIVMEEIKSLEDLIHFQPLPESKEIIVPEKNVSELLQQILKMQEPEQMKYYKRVQEEAMLARGRAREMSDLHDKKQVHAQIITLKQRAA